MKKTVCFFLCVLGVGTGLFPQSREGSQGIPQGIRAAFTEAGIPVLREPVSLIDFALPLLDGTTRNTKDLRGKVLFLNFWATWCGPCRAEMPSMETLYRRFKNRGLEFLAVNLQESRPVAAAFMDQLGLSFPVALDKLGSTGAAYGVRSIPTTYIVNREGKIIARITGSLNWDNPKLFSAFDVLLDSP
ncbi:MAG: TlpA family protein disulfide reductase [Spirochaetaceae bacterium]|jgi:thiol-disulfide isomerase/thioredoxin|nr:TlpA family protein disulfide reductase [Spirochaetaceae bacterium]